MQAYLVHYRLYQGAKKGKQVASSTEWGLGENVVLRYVRCSMERSTPTVSFDIFMDNYFTSFRLLTHLGVNNIRTTDVLNKNRLRKCTTTGEKQLQKKETFPLSTVQRTSSKKGVSLVWLV